jgi:hypothetical protein
LRRPNQQIEFAVIYDLDLLATVVGCRCCSPGRNLHIQVVLKIKIPNLFINIKKDSNKKQSSTDDIKLTMILKNQQVRFYGADQACLIPCSGSIFSCNGGF